MKVPFLLGRLVFGGFFLYSGINHFRHSRKLADYTASKNVPFPGMAVTVSGAMLSMAGASILLGLKPKFGVAAIACFLGGASPLIHDFWRQRDPELRSSETIHFMKNMALLGAAFGLLGVDEPWPISLPVEQEPGVLDRARKAARRLAA